MFVNCLTQVQAAIREKPVLYDQYPLLFSVVSCESPTLTAVLAHTTNLPLFPI
ncbi:MAG: hypothetical protein P8176_16695 [Gammaproteobacteria bacterium]